MTKNPTPRRLIYGTYPGFDAGDRELFDADLSGNTALDMARSGAIRDRQ